MQLPTMDEMETKKLAQKQFGRAAGKYVTSQVHSSKADLDFVSNFVQPQANWKVLDIATGTGHLALRLAETVSEVFATDITPEMLVEAERIIAERSVNNVSTYVVDVHSIPYESGFFDLTASRIAPHHFHDISLAVQEMVRVTKANGHVFIQDTVAPEDSDASVLFNTIERLRDPSHVRDLSPSEWLSLLEESGCEIVRYTTKPKNWPLRWWTERMSTPPDKVLQIIGLLEENYDLFKDTIHIQRSDVSDMGGSAIDEWTLWPHNGYFLARKV